MCSYVLTWITTKSGRKLIFISKKKLENKHKQSIVEHNLCYVIYSFHFFPQVIKSTEEAAKTRDIFR